MEKNKILNMILKRKKIVYFILIILSFIPEFLAFSPVILSYDGPSEIYNEITTQHPILYTILMKAFYFLGRYVFHSASIGMMLFSIMQISIMAFVFANTVEFVRVNSKKKYFHIIVLLLFMIFPYNKIFPLITTKDVLFGGSFLLFIINLCEYLRREKNTTRDSAILIITSLFMLLFRNNAIYALLMVLPFTVIILRKKRSLLLKLIIDLSISIILYYIISNIFLLLLKPRIAPESEKFSVISQAIARISTEKYEELSESDKTKISYYFEDINHLVKKYNPILADNTKALIVDSRVKDNKLEFLKFSLGLMSKYPKTTLESFFSNMRGYWDVFDNTFCTLHQDESGNEEFGVLEIYIKPTGNDSSIFVKEFNMFNPLKELYKYLFCQNNYRKIPILYIAFQPALYFYLTIGYIIMSIYKKSKSNMIVGILMLMYFITCFLGPCAIIRYVYCIIISVPVMFCTLIGTKTIES